MAQDYFSETLPLDEADLGSFLDHCNANDGIAGDDYIISFDHFGNVEDWTQGSIEAVYYSKKIKHTIVLSIEMPTEFKSLEELVDSIVAFNDQALALENNLPTL